MSEELNDAAVCERAEYYDDSFSARLIDWVRAELIWYAGSFTVHLMGLALLLLAGSFTTQAVVGSVPEINQFNQAEEANQQKPETPFEKPDYDVGPVPDERPLVLDPNPTPLQPTEAATTVEPSAKPIEVGPGGAGGGTPDGRKSVGMGGADLRFFGPGTGPKLIGPGGLGPGRGTGSKWGEGGNAAGPRGLAETRRSKLAPDIGITGERCVVAALIWLARHQLSDGGWSLQRYNERCTDKSCTGTGVVAADAGATAMGVLPFLAAGQTHKTRGTYRANVAAGINWLMQHQKPDGDLAFGHAQKMYSHALATIALCEDYAMTGDKHVGLAAQGAVNFIIAAQNKSTGGWRYNPGEEGDTSVVGWQIMALKSAQMAGLNVGGSSGGGAAFAGGSKWLDSVAVGSNGSQFCYQPGTGSANTMTSVGLLCRQYLGAKPHSPMMADGVKYLMNHMPDAAMPNVYYWYYGAQVMHNMMYVGSQERKQWDQWSRQARRVLVKSQCREDPSACNYGSWDPSRDQWGRQGGRLMTTSLSCLTLEVYYRFLPLFKAEGEMGAEK
jgi:hypothetical protein